ncbi:T9SS type A sorting domain-containing protein [Mucilaginibacter aquatilis]|uniref:T9SS type A sorting domain-containing protein n=1 Tax=Mucilaginibacter aquatilis TaxID=1517760 RepID=A0A6I4IDH9_9SPHI|nr:T9SS type A sorting domain-containing protein [Mucilaginibacter aquatilis]MVN93057.1 T9SS type A sorting domain-containing protein [Mucilaginibacter aquatilis]
MGQRYTFNYLWITLIAAAISINFAFTLGLGSHAKADTIYARKTRSAKNSYLKNGLTPGSMPQIKPSPYSNIKPTIPVSTDKLLNNVQIFPTTVVDQINVKYMVSRNVNVTIKIVDVLGNNVATLFSDRVESGEKKFTSPLPGNLTSGFYFLRVMVGTESVIRRITVL